MSQSQKSHWAKKIAAIRNHTLVVATYSGGVSQTHVALLKHYKNHTKLAVPDSKELASEGVFGVAVIFFELRLQSQAICDYEVAAIRVTKSKAQRGKHFLGSLIVFISFFLPFRKTGT